MSKAKEIFDKRYAYYRNMLNKPAIPLEARQLILDAMEEYHQSKLKNNGALGDVNVSKTFDIHNCINEVCEAVHARFHLYGQTTKGDSSFRWKVKQAIDKMLYSC